MKSAVDVRLKREPEAAARTRQILEPLRDLLNPESFEDIRFLTNELVTNSIVHNNGDEIRVRVHVTDAVARVVVEDAGGTGIPTPQDPHLMDTRGRGLLIIERLASRWGLTINGGTAVWFELDMSG
jgi:anti-sigma regulatory factor (Ser/Thr protein kinase)